MRNFILAMCAVALITVGIFLVFPWLLKILFMYGDWVMQ